MSVISMRRAGAWLALVLLYGQGVMYSHGAAGGDRHDTPELAGDPASSEGTWEVNVGELLEAPEATEHAIAPGHDGVISLDDPLYDPLYNAETDSSEELLTPAPAPSDIGIDQAGAQLLASYQHTVDQLLDTSGAYDPRLGEVYYDMASTLHHFGDLDNALRAYEQSMYIARINDGIYSVSQAPMLRGIASCHEDLHQWEEASNHYRHLLWLHQQTLGSESPRLIPLLGELSAWYLKAYNNHPGRPGTYLSESERLARLGLHLTGSEDHIDLDETLSLLRNLAAGQYLWAQHLRRNPPRESGFEFAGQANTANRIRATSELDMMIGASYRVGRSAYEKLIEILTLNPGIPPEEVASAMAELGDWHMRYGYQAAARDSYRDAYHYLVQHRDQAIAEEFFAQPNLIQPLWPVNRDIDVVADVTVDSRGRATSLEIQEIGDEQLRNRMQRHLRVARFRPSLQNGEPETAPYRLAQRIAVQ